MSDRLPARDPLVAMIAELREPVAVDPGSKRRLMNMVKNGRLDLTPLLTHSVSLRDITEGYRIFGERLGGVLKVAVRPEQ